jgi:hypothetical protein
VTQVCLVAVRPETFEFCREGLYPVPVDYSRNDREFERFGFYQVSPVSAVTHTARIQGSRVEEPGESISDEQWNAPGLSGDSRAVVYRLGVLQELEHRVENDLSSGLRGAWYASMDDLRSAEVLSDLQ